MGVSTAAPATRGAGLGILYMVASVFVFSASSVLVKWTAASYPVVQIVFFRNFFALVPTAILLWTNGGPLLLRTHHPASHLYRATLGLVAMMLIFYALSIMPIASATALSFTAPLFLTALSMPLLGERVGVYRWSAVLVGFAGVLVISRPGHELFNLGALAVLGSTLTYALAMISVRRMSRTEHPITIAAYFALICTLVSGVLQPFFWRTPGIVDFTLLALIGVASGIGQYCQTQAFRLAPVAVIGIFNYLGILFAGFFGYVIWNEVPLAHVWIGAAIVMACGIFIVYRETRRAPAAA